jgi:hypothetical protein
VVGIQAYLAMVGRRRGRTVPWSITIATDPPNCASARLNRIESFLLVVVTPLGALLAIAGIPVTIWVGDTMGAVLIIVGFLLLSARGIFVAACYAYADLVDEPSAPATT